ncbi:hypothetical protein FB45DRAFT_1014401 [Roridomyces roridus]|uniref:Uncharacterized protein n=1 Tax=Roridomyces roridus TaxID=1738132 RepID=A0AAD7AXT1_9AGAR|nr:hypothetical protein FB45DRAFT_1014401 [Roridomyces roridus]
MSMNMRGGAWRCYGSMRTDLGTGEMEVARRERVNEIVAKMANVVFPDERHSLEELAWIDDDPSPEDVAERDVRHRVGLSDFSQLRTLTLDGPGKPFISHILSEHARRNLRGDLLPQLRHLDVVLSQQMQEYPHDMWSSDGWRATVRHLGADFRFQASRVELAVFTTQSRMRGMPAPYLFGEEAPRESTVYRCAPYIPNIMG